MSMILICHRPLLLCYIDPTPMCVTIYGAQYIDIITVNRFSCALDLDHIVVQFVRQTSLRDQLRTK